MSISLYEISIPVFLRGLANLSYVLEKGAAFADEKGMSHAELTEARLFPDMLPLTGQIQRASDTAKFVPVRVGGVENLPMPDNEVTFADMQARVATTVDFLKAMPADAFNGADDREVIVKGRTGDRVYTGRSYLLDFALPNFFFHTTTAYGILRHKGVPVGKMDFLRGRP
ncbi:MAG: DUF1993 domain-containing protein [Rhizobiaceae bacterium]|nr:DUF1993 domain-containing protein [Rhizobiaceae bacterium]